MYRIHVDTSVSVKRTTIGTVHAQPVIAPKPCSHGTYHDPHCTGCIARDEHRARIETERDALHA